MERKGKKIIERGSPKWTALMPAILAEVEKQAAIAAAQATSASAPSQSGGVPKS